MLTMQDPHNPYAAPATAELGPVASDHVDGGELAGRGQRLLASIIDTVLIIVVIIVAVVLGVISTDEKASKANELVGVLIAVVAHLAINGWLLHTQGQTLGKKLMGIRIVRGDGKPGSILDFYVKRTLPIQIIALIPIGNFFSLIDALFIFRADRRCIHDQFAGTEVIASTSSRPRKLMDMPPRQTPSPRQ